MNQRLAAHKNRKGPTLAEPAKPMAVQHGASSIAAQAAARVAARYAKAPSYSEMLADEARAAVRAAEAASRAALHAQAAAESVLAGLEAASEAEDPWEPEVTHTTASEQAWESSAAAVQHVAPVQPAAPALSQAAERPSFGIRWEPELPVRPAEPVAMHASRGIDSMAASAENWWEPSPLVEEDSDSGPIEVVEPAQPIHANLIEFPREIVATRKARPRMAEGAYAAAAEHVGQLSIFEVDPEAVSAQPIAAEAVVEESAPVWTEPVWSGIELDAQPEEELAAQYAVAQAPDVRDAQTAALEQAPMGVRLMAAVVDATLITGAFLAAVAVAVSNLKDLPGMREMEVGAVVALLTTGLLYQIVFFTLGEATPGMKYAHLSLCTFDGQRPTRAQRCSRLGALLLSLLPVGLGVAWALFDDGHLSWHDRLSKTYLRKYLA